MMRAMRIALILGHPAPRSYCHALAEHYAEGARAGGHEVTLIKLGEIQFAPILTSKAHQSAPLEPDLIAAQEAMKQADHLVFIYPLWLGFPPALLKGFLERSFTPGFAYQEGKMFSGLLKGKSARIILTMGMPAWFYRFVYGAHSAKALKRNILHFCGVRPVRMTYFGGIEAVSDATRKKWLGQVKALGQRGA